MDSSVANNSSSSSDDEDLLSITPVDVDLQSDEMPEVSPQEIDSLVDEQVSKLSLKERESITNDIYGIRPEMVETRQLIQSSLEQMDKELDRLEGISAYEMAALQDPDYVQNESFRLRFLRTDLYDAKKAAWRLAQHFQVKLDLFGKDKLVKDITQDDLDEDTLHALYNGFSQFLPLRDRSGRLVHVQFVIPPHVDLMTKVRMDFYMCMVKSEDEATQRKGCVGIRFYNGQWLQQKQLQHRSSVATKQPKQTPSKFQSWQASKLLTVVPIRPSAMHLCHDSNSIWSPVFAVMKYVMGFVLRNRTREHYGTHEQCLFELQTFGIATQNQSFPLTDDGQITTDFHQEAWNKRRNLERLRESRRNNSSGEPAPPEPEPFSISSQHDVLLGRGKRYYEHLGNVRFRYWVASRAEQYNSTSSVAEKKQLTSEVVELVKQAGGRFLKDDNHAGWEQVDDETARLKVSHVFRNLRTKAKGTDGRGGEKRMREG